MLHFVTFPAVFGFLNGFVKHAQVGIEQFEAVIFEVMVVHLDDTHLISDNLFHLLVIHVGLRVTHVVIEKLLEHLHLLLLIQICWVYVYDASATFGQCILDMKSDMLLETG